MAGTPTAAAPLRQAVRRAERRRSIRAVVLVLPLTVFLLLSFVLPIANMLWQSVSSPEVQDDLPHVAREIRNWDGRSTPPLPLVEALIFDLSEASKTGRVGIVARRLNYGMPGFRSLLTKTAGKVASSSGEMSDPLAALIAIDSRWKDISYWREIERASGRYTDFFLLASLDLQRNDAGEIVLSPPDQRIYIDLFARTIWISLVVTIATFVIGYPIAYFLANAAARLSNLLMALVLIPFWSSILVRSTAWIVLLRQEGLVNDTGVAMGLWSAPLQLVHNRFGTYVAMVHVLLPFMILSIYSVMKGISPLYMKAAGSLGAGPIRSFLEVYFPLSLPGVAAGSLLVFVLSLGYYITPALVGGSGDQMVSSLIAVFTNKTINWGMAASLSVILLTVVLAFVYIYDRVVGITATGDR